MSIMDTGTAMSTSWETQVLGQNYNGENGGHGAHYRVIDGLADAARRLGVEAEDRRVEAREQRQRAATATAELLDFRTQVRDLLAEWVGDGTISKAVAQDAVAQLDLPPLTRTFTVEARVTLEEVCVTVEVEAVDEDAAADSDALDDLITEAVRDALSNPYGRPGVSDWETDRVYVA